MNCQQHKQVTYRVVVVKKTLKLFYSFKCTKLYLKGFRLGLVWGKESHAKQTLIIKMRVLMYQ